MISVNADFLLQSFVIPIFLILPEFILSSSLTQSLQLEFSSSLSSDVLKRRFKATHFLFYMPWRYQISITKCLYSSREDLPKKLFKITVQEGKKHFRLNRITQKRRCLNSQAMSDQHWLGTLFSDVIGLFQEQESELIISREWQISPTLV